MGMLQRIFSRGAPEGRIEQAIEHEETSREREALRARSAAILGRLDQKKRKVRAQETAQRAAEDEAIHAEAPEALPAIGEETPTAPPAESKAVTGTSLEETPSQEVEPASEDLAPMTEPHHEEPSGDAFAPPPFAGLSPPEETVPDVDDGAEEQQLFTESRPLRDNSPPMDRDEEKPVPASGGAPRAPAADDEAIERLRLKAEEARSRIAERLRSNENNRIDLGADVPPLHQEID